MKLLIKLVLGLAVLLIIILYFKDLYREHEVVQAMDEVLKERIPALQDVENLYRDVKTSVATASIEESDAREKAWQQWYQAPADCRKEILGYDIVECTDHRIGARKEFEALWEGNMLQGEAGN